MCKAEGGTGVRGCTQAAPAGLHAAGGVVGGAHGGCGAVSEDHRRISDTERRSPRLFLSQIVVGTQGEKGDRNERKLEIYSRCL